MILALELCLPKAAQDHGGNILLIARVYHHVIIILALLGIPTIKRLVYAPIVVMHTGTIDKRRLTIEQKASFGIITEGTNTMLYGEFSYLDRIELRLLRRPQLHIFEHSRLIELIGVSNVNGSRVGMRSIC